MNGRDQVGIDVVARDMATSTFNSIGRTADNFGERLGRIGRGISSVGTKVGTLGRSISVNLTLPLTALGVAVFGLGSDYEATLNKIVGLTGVSREQLNKWKPEIESIAEATGIGPGKLAEALYFVTSAVSDTSKSMDVLEVAAKMSGAGMGDVEVIAASLTSVMNAYGKTNLSASRAGDILTATIKDAAFESDALASVLGDVVPAAAQLGVPLKDVGGALASMSKVGLDASRSAISLNQIFTNLLSPTREGEKALKKVGLSYEGLRQQLKEKGTLSVLKTLDRRFKGNDEAMGKVFGNVRSLRGVFALLSQDSGAVADTMNRVRTSTGDLDTAFEEVHQGGAADMADANASLQVSMLSLSAALLPVVSAIAKLLVGAIRSAVEAFNSLSPEMQTAIVYAAGLLAIIGPVTIIMGSLIGAVGSLVTVMALGSGAVGLFMLALLALAAVGAAIVFQDAWLPELERQAKDARTSIEDGVDPGPWERAMLAIDDARHTFLDPLKDQMDNVADAWGGAQQLINGDWRGFWNLLGGAARLGWEMLILPFRIGWGVIKGIFHQIGIDIETPIRKAIDWIVGHIRNGVNQIIAAWNSIDISLPGFTLSWPRQGFEVNTPLGNAFVGFDAGNFKMWDPIADLFPDVRTGRADERVGARRGSHAGGLWNVPFDEYPALLHRREMVVPSDFAEMLRANGGGWGGGGGDVTIINNYGPSSVRSEEDIRQIGVHQARRARMLGLSTGRA
jgi:TP901 family phage tail tape measure protein